MIKLKKLNLLPPSRNSNYSISASTSLRPSRNEIGQSPNSYSQTSNIKATCTATALRERFIQRLMLSGKKSVATKVFDESLELLMNYIKEHNSKSDSRLRRQDNLYSLANLTKDEIFIISLRKAQP
jgi:phosphoribosyl-ATP pyrophosphohydrolase